MAGRFNPSTSNGYRVHIVLEVGGLAYRVHGVNVWTDDAFQARSVG